MVVVGGVVVVVCLGIVVVKVLERRVCVFGCLGIVRWWLCVGTVSWCLSVLRMIAGGIALCARFNGCRRNCFSFLCRMQAVAVLWIYSDRCRSFNGYLFAASSGCVVLCCRNSAKAKDDGIRKGRSSKLLSSQNVQYTPITCSCSCAQNPSDQITYSQDLVCCTLRDPRRHYPTSNLPSPPKKSPIRNLHILIAPSNLPSRDPTSPSTAHHSQRYVPIFLPSTPTTKLATPVPHPPPRCGARPPQTETKNQHQLPKRVHTHASRIQL